MLEEANARNNFSQQSAIDQQAQLVHNHAMEMMLQRTYKHMINRMQADLIACQIEANELQESHKSKQQIAAEETEKNRKAKQQKLEALNKLEEFMRLID